MKRIFTILVSMSLIACATSKNKAEKKDIAASEQDETPILTKPKIKSYVVPDTIEGNKYIKSHRVYLLEDAGAWSKD